MTQWIFIHPWMTFFLSILVLIIVEKIVMSVLGNNKTENHYHTHNHYQNSQNEEAED